MGDWEAWGDCTSPCAGIKERTRTIVTSAYGPDAKHCKGHTKEIVPCNPEYKEPTPKECNAASAKAIDCLFTTWSEYSACSVTCGAGQHRRSRAIIDAVHGGRQCGGMLEEIDQCTAGDCPGGAIVVDCVWGLWSQWSACTQSGQQSRHRVIISLNRNGGQDCPPGPGRETKSCRRKTITKKIYCTWGDWEEWAQCAATCGEGGSRQRVRRLQLTSHSSDMERLYESNERLREVSEKVQSGRIREMVMAFACGALSLVLIMAAVRTLSRSSSGSSRALPRPLFDFQAPQQRIEVL